MKNFKKYIVEKLNVGTALNSNQRKLGKVRLKKNQFIAFPGKFYSWFFNVDLDKVDEKELDSYDAWFYLIEDDTVDFNSISEVLDFVREHADDEVIATVTESEYGNFEVEFNIDEITFFEECVDDPREYM